MTWVHCSDDVPTYSQNELQQEPGDIVEFAICLANLNGLINLESLIFEELEVIPISSNERNALVYNKDVKALIYKNEKRKTKKVVCNTNRICEVEDSVVEWLSVSKLNQPKLYIDLEPYLSHFSVLQV